MENYPIAKTTDAMRDALKRASAQGLPNRPSERGMKAEDVKKAFWKPMLDASNSLLAELDRVVDSMNDILVGKGLENTLLTDAKSLVAAINEVRERANAANVLIGDGTLEGAENLIEAANALAEDIEAAEERVGAAEVQADANRQQIGRINEKIGSGMLSTAAQSIVGAINEVLDSANGANNKADNTNIEIVGIRARLAGVARSFVIPTGSDFKDFADGYRPITVEGEEIYVKDLQTGDNLLIVEHGMPDYWFEKTNDGRYADEHKNVAVICRDLDSGLIVGLMHVAETDYTVIANHAMSAQQASSAAGLAATAAEGHATRVKEIFDTSVKLPGISVSGTTLYFLAPHVATLVGDALVFEIAETVSREYVDETVGDIDAALDAILAIQNGLIGGSGS